MVVLLPHFIIVKPNQSQSTADGLHSIEKREVGALQDNPHQIQRVRSLAGNRLGLVFLLVVKDILDIPPRTEVVIDLQATTNVGKDMVVGKPGMKAMLDRKGDCGLKTFVFLRIINKFKRHLSRSQSPTQHIQCLPQCILKASLCQLQCSGQACQASSSHKDPAGDIIIA